MPSAVDKVLEMLKPAIKAAGSQLQHVEACWPSSVTVVGQHLVLLLIDLPGDLPETDRRRS